MKTGISKQVRDKVLERDSWDGRACCIICGSPYNIELHHYIPRSRGGMGVEKNLVCLCHECHQKIHSIGDDSKVKNYLDFIYQNIEDNEVIFSKW